MDLNFWEPLVEPILLFISAVVWTRRVGSNAKVDLKSSMNTGKERITQLFDEEGDDKAMNGVGQICGVANRVRGHINWLLTIGASWFATGCILASNWIGGSKIIHSWWMPVSAIASGLLLIYTATWVRNAQWLNWQPVFEDVTKRYRAEGSRWGKVLAAQIRIP